MKNLFLSGIIFISISISISIPVSSAACSTPPLDTLCHIVHDGITRTYLMHIPANIDTSKSIPLMIVLHGGHGSGKRMVELTKGGFDNLADQENFIVVYPNGIRRNWNDGRLDMPASYKAHNCNINDVGFISALIDEMVKTKNADPKRVYVTGMSNGAIMTHRLAIELSDKIAAAAPVCGNIPADLKSLPANSVAIMMINGTDDPLVPFEGGYVHFNKKKLGKILSTSESASFWVKNNKISSTPVISALPDTNTADSCHVLKTTFGEREEPREVVLITIEGGGHTWAGGWQYINERWIGKTCRDFDACIMIWEFCKLHSK